MPIITSYSNIVALVIDDMATQQSTLRGQLGMLGISKVDQASGPDEAVRLINAKRYGLILCDYRLNHKSDGQQLFEYLRDSALLAADCLFFMVTAENGYASVVAATEHRPDSYLLKPITAGDIEDRLKALLERRAALLPINERLTRNDLAGALEACDKVLLKKDRWAMQALQLKGQTLLQLGRPEDAATIFGAALAQRPGLIWAQLGLARAHKAANRFEDAKAVARQILESKDGAKSVDAYDVLAQSLEAQGEHDGALWALRDAATVVPSARRQRLVAESAYRQGELEIASEAMSKVCAATKGALTAQPQDTLMLAQTLVDMDEPARALTLLDDAGTAPRNNPQQEGVALAIRAQGLARTGDMTGAAAAAAKARQTLRGAKLDLATVAIAKAELVTGNEAAGMKLLQQAMSADHENPRARQMVGNALRATGREAQVDGVVLAATATLSTLVTDAKRMFRDSKIDEALQVIEKAIADYPDNTGVLLQAAQMNCMAMRLKKEVDPPLAERVRLYLSRLDRLMPFNHRVAQMQRYYRETVFTLGTTATAGA